MVSVGSLQDLSKPAYDWSVRKMYRNLSGPRTCRSRRHIAANSQGSCTTYEKIRLVGLPRGSRYLAIEDIGLKEQTPWCCLFGLQAPLPKQWGLETPWLVSSSSIVRGISSYCVKLFRDGRLPLRVHNVVP